MKFDLFQTSDYYEALTKWWQEQKWPAVPLDHLPSKGCGVFLRGELVAAGFLYINTTALSNFEWVVASPAVRHAERTEALSLLFEGAAEFAKMAEIKSIYMSTRHQSLIGRLEKHGFQKTDVSMTNLVRKV